MKESDRKLKVELATDALPAFLRELAGAVEAEAGANVDNDDDDLATRIQGYRKIRLQIKRKDNRASIRLKVKPAQTAEEPSQDSPTPSPTGAPTIGGVETTLEKAVAPTADPAVESKPKYKRLKKRMKNTFKEIRVHLEEQRLPEEEIVRQFCDDSALMITYPGKGDPHYADYGNAAANLLAAYERKDYAGFKSLVATLADLKNVCHKAYK